MLDKVNDVKKTLLEGGYTCVIQTANQLHTSRERGVKPLLTFLHSGENFQGAVGADKTVGAGAAYLYVLLGVKALWVNVISESALEILKNNEIAVYYERCVPYIINRKGDGVCPIEEAVSCAQTAQQAYACIVKKLAQLQDGNAQ